MSRAADSPIRPRTRTIDGLTVRFAESAPAAQDAILLSPWPESIFAFDQVWARLAREAHLVAVDPPGFGGSDRSEALLSPKAMGDFVLKVADAFSLERPHIVGPDIGTSSVLFAAASRPGRFSSVVVGSGGAAVPLDLTGVLKEWVEAPDLEQYRRIDGRDVVDIALSTIEGYQPPDHIREDYRTSYAGEGFAESMRYARAYPEQLPELGALLPTINVPVRVVQGDRDQVVPAANAEYLGRLLPHSQVDFLPAGHFCWEEKPAEYAGLVADWWNSHPGPGAA